MQPNIHNYLTERAWQIARSSHRYRFETGDACQPKRSTSHMLSTPGTTDRHAVVRPMHKESKRAAYHSKTCQHLHSFGQGLSRPMLRTRVFSSAVAMLSILTDHKSMICSSAQPNPIEVLFHGWIRHHIMSVRWSCCRCQISHM